MLMGPGVEKGNKIAEVGINKTHTLCFWLKKILILYLIKGLFFLEHHRGCQAKFSDRDTQFLCNRDHTCVTSSIRPSWRTFKTRSFLYVTNAVLAVSWTSFCTTIPVHTRGLTTCNKQITIIKPLFKNSFFVHLIIE